MCERNDHAAESPAAAEREAGRVADQPPGMQFAFEARVDLGPVQEIGKAAHGGERRVIPIAGGTFAGPGIQGRVLNGGADWQILRADGSAELDARYTLETDSGASIYVANQGLRNGPPEVLAQLKAGEPVDPASYYFRTVPKFETAAPELQWLSRSIFICTGERLPNQVILRVWRIL